VTRRRREMPAALSAPLPAASPAVDRGTRPRVFASEAHTAAAEDL
jgi:hypothetical protein